MAQSFVVECHRCGNQQPTPRAGHYSEADYLELWHEFMDLEARLKVEHGEFEHRLTMIETALVNARADLAIALAKEYLRKYYAAQLETV